VATSGDSERRLAEPSSSVGTSLVRGRGSGITPQPSGASRRASSSRRAAGIQPASAAEAATFAELRDQLPARLAWALEPAHSPADLWKAEAAWWDRVEREGFQLLRASTLDWHPVLGAAALLCADARRVRAALELAARGGGPLEAYDALA